MPKNLILRPRNEKCESWNDVKIMVTHQNGKYQNNHNPIGTLRSTGLVRPGVRFFEILHH